MRIRPEILTVLALLSVGPAALAQAQQPAPDAIPAVLELFTSQGCSSCPPADELLKTFAARPDVIALSMPVDYWDHLGWRDTLAAPKNAARQRAYAKALGTGNVYTPQIIINGSAQAVGSQRVEIEKAITQTALPPAKAVSIHIADDGSRTKIDIGASHATGEAASGTVWLVKLSPRAEVEIKRGENRGRTMSYVNVVREISPVGMWSGKELHIELPSSVVTEPGHRCAVLLQAGETGRILGAAWMAP